MTTSISSLLKFIKIRLRSWYESKVPKSGLPGAGLRIYLDKKQMEARRPRKSILVLEVLFKGWNVFRLLYQKV